MFGKAPFPPDRLAEIVRRNSLNVTRRREFSSVLLDAVEDEVTAWEDAFGRDPKIRAYATAMVVQSFAGVTWNDAPSDLLLVEPPPFMRAWAELHGLDAEAVFEAEMLCYTLFDGTWLPTEDEFGARSYRLVTDLRGAVAPRANET